jgi:GNAT superfamily N-acetyltransferase
LIEYRVREPVSRDALDELFRISWDPAAPGPSLDPSLTWITAHDGEILVGFANVAWDGRAHAFLLDPTVLPSHRRRGIGTALVRNAVEEARRSGVQWLHVDYEPQLAGFYEACGFRPTSAGVIDLAESRD